jgi:hypothetical protein
MRILVTLLIASSGLLLGCSTVQERLAAYHGVHKNYLVADFGPPDQTLSDGRDGEIWIYQEEDVSRSTAREDRFTPDDSGRYSPDESVVYTPSQTSVRLNNTTFFIDGEGFVYNSAYNSRSVRR